MPVGILTKETKVEIEIHPFTGETKKDNDQYYLILWKFFHASYL